MKACELMDEEIKQNLIKLEMTKQKLFAAFAEAKLGDGIGYYQAVALDGYISKSSPKYKEANAQDEQLNRQQLYEIVGSANYYNDFVHVWMDAKGMHFFLPIFLLCAESDTVDKVLRDLVAQEEPKYKELMSLLSVEQKKCIIKSIEDDVDYDSWVAFYLSFKGHECHKCKQTFLYT